MRIGVYIALLWACAVSLAGCKVYSLSGQNITADSAIIYNFTNRSSNTAAYLSQEFTDGLKERFIQRTNVRLVNFNGDIEIGGAITKYSVSGQAPTGNDITALNRLTISVEVVFTDNRDPDNSWKQTFTRFADFDSSNNLVDVEDELLDQIYEQLLEDIFNKAFSNW